MIMKIHNNRLTILSDVEVNDLYTLPAFSDDERAFFLILMKKKAHT